MLHEGLEEGQQRGGGRRNFVQSFQGRVRAAAHEEVGARRHSDRLLRLALHQHCRHSAHRDRPGPGALDARGQFCPQVFPVFDPIPVDRSAHVFRRQERPELFRSESSESDMQRAVLQLGLADDADLRCVGISKQVKHRER